MCQFASAYPLEILNKMVEVNRLLQNPTLEHVLNQTKEFNQLVQEPLAQLGAITEMLSAIYDSDIRKIEKVFKQSPIVRTNWASHVILLNTKLPLGERYWYITQAVANGWSSNVRLKLISLLVRLRLRK